MDLYITDITSLILPDTKKITPRERYIQYYLDLYRLYHQDISHETFYQGGQYSFSEIGEQLLASAYENDFIKKIDILIPVSWSHEFDPDYSSCGVYLKEKFQIDCNIFDICDQGSLATFTALHVMQRYFANGQYQNGMIIALEQTAIPRNSMHHGAMPSWNGGCSVLVQSSNQSNCIVFKVIESIVFNLSHLNEILESLADKSLNTIRLVTKKSSLIKKQIKKKLNYFYDYMPSKSSIFSLYFYLEKVMKYEGSDASDYIVILDEDAESWQAGILILKTIRP